MNPRYQQTTFMTSAPNVDLAPADEGYEIAFAGRSNAGKSSAINTLTSQKSLARTSKTPGRTQLLNFFQVDDHRRFVDLPGYGYAKVPSRVKAEWHLAMEGYLKQRQSLAGMFLLMDIRRPLTEFDQQMLEWCEYNELPLHIALTKADKLKYGASKNTLLAVERALQDAEVEVSVQLFSATKKTGLEDAYKILDQWLKVDSVIENNDSSPE